ncbi:MAG: 50S ribosomal protein L24 [Acutalibacteraceae bacterium]
MANLNVRKGDNVMVIAGKDKGKAGKVLAVNPDSGRIYVEGVNIISKSKKPRNAQDKGGILKQEGAIDSSNVMHICDACGAVVRVRHTKEEADGKAKSVRVCAKCGASLDEKKSSAKKAAKKAAKKKSAAKSEKKD